MRSNPYSFPLPLLFPPLTPSTFSPRLQTNRFFRFDVFHEHFVPNCYYIIGYMHDLENALGGSQALYFMAFLLYYCGVSLFSRC